MDPRDRAAIDGADTQRWQELSPEQAEGLDAYQARVTADHGGCTTLTLDLDHDPDAKAVARIYAARVAVTRPQLSADLRRLTDDELRPGETYVTPDQVQLPGEPR